VYRTDYVLLHFQHTFFSVPSHQQKDSDWVTDMLGTLEKWAG